MPHKPKTTESQQSSPTLREPVSGKMWALRGIEDVYFQREAQVTWWTVLGGLSVGAVLTRLDSLPEAIANGRWYYLCYCLAILLVIVNSWVQTAWGSLILKWPLSIPTSLIYSFQGIAMAVAGLSITNPVLWYGSMVVVLLTAVLNQLSFAMMHAWATLPRPLVDRAKSSIRIYFAFLVYTIVATIALALWPGKILEMSLGLFALVTAIFALVWQHLGMLEEKQQLNVP